jgi:hypothetical protein
MQMGGFLSTVEIQAALDRGQELDFSRHGIEAPRLTLCERFFPLGFVVELRTNSEEILSLAREVWFGFEQRFDNRPIRVDVHVLEGDVNGDAPEECPPTPAMHMMLPLLINVADANNCSVANLDEGSTRIAIARATLRHRNYLGYFLLAAAPLCHIASRLATPVHAGCVAFKGRGMLLLGDSGAGKSSLSYACARAGWTYTTDDGSYLLHDDNNLTVTGDCHRVRFRPSAGELFPEIEGLEITPRAAGKPSIEMPTTALPWMNCAPTATVGFLIFLNRRAGGPQVLEPFSKDVARCVMRQVLLGSDEARAVHYRIIERLLNTQVLELRYTDLDWAVQRLQRLAEEGR